MRLKGKGRLLFSGCVTGGAGEGEKGRGVGDWLGKGSRRFLWVMPPGALGTGLLEPSGFVGEQ